MNEAVFDTPWSFRPQFRFKAEIRPNKGLLEFRLKVDRALARDRPKLCSDEKRPTTNLTLSFTFDDGINFPVTVEGVHPWECTKTGRYHMRSRSREPRRASDEPELDSEVEFPVPRRPRGNNELPKANLRVEKIDDATIELDGTRSTDRDGTIVQYVFESGDGQVQEGPEATAEFFYEPGEYVASLRVVDDDGAGSRTETRRFSVR